MDPDEVLAQLRQHVREWETAQAGSLPEREAAEKVSADVSALDDWLSHGGRYPSDWSGPRATA